jgi:hypothetical protein
MKSSKLFLCLSILLAITVFSSCDSHDDIETNVKGELVFGFSDVTQKDGAVIINKNLDNATYVLISVKDANGEMVYELEILPLFKFGDNFITRPISLLVGNYELTQFLVTDDKYNVLYVAPIEGSDNAYLVENPLPISFNIAMDNVTKVLPEVVSIDGYLPEDFGYTTFSFNLVETFRFLIGVFIYNYEIDNFELTNAYLEVSAEDNVLYSKELLAITNQVAIRDGYDNYTLVVSKDGYKTYTETFTNDQIKLHFNSEDLGPLVVTLEKYNQIVHIIKPGPEDNRDAYLNSVNFYALDTVVSIIASAWTYGGVDGIGRSFIDFPLPEIPENVSNFKAVINLYHNPNSLHTGHYGSNSFKIERIIQAWEPGTLNWTNQPVVTSLSAVVLPTSTTNTQNYTNIDVTSLILDSYENPNSSFGFRISLITEQKYRSVVFGSGDSEDESIRPSLVISYED